jgi:tetratricopeptide (TPR) repeat protein
MKSKPNSRASIAPTGSDYRQHTREADKILIDNHVEFRSDNWQQLALDWFTPHEPDREELARYIAAHSDRLGVTWAREVLRLQVYLEVQDHAQIVEHYDRAFRVYPRCALFEVWVAGFIMRTSGDFWRARQMYWNVAAELPTHAKPHYELGFMNYLLGDFSGAVNEFDQAVALVEADDAELGARIYYNRGLVRFALHGASAKSDAIADVEEALRRRPNYAQAKDTLRVLKGISRWTPWK